MKYKIENGTDGACMALYDKKALPENFDAMADMDSSQDLFDIEEQGNCAIIHTDGDGSHWMHLYVNEPAPNEFKKFSINHIEMNKLNIPSGKLHFTGCEYMSNINEEYDHEKNELINIDSGSYKADIHFLQYSDSFIKRQINEKLSASSKRILNLHKALGSFSLIGIAAALITMLEKSFFGGFIFFLPLFVWLAFFQLSSFVKADDEKEELLSELPSVLAELNKRN